MPVKAFKEAEGFGAYTVGGRDPIPSNIKCYLINTLDDNEDAPEFVVGSTNTYTSSWRSALKATGPRFIVPVIGGVCTLTLSDSDTSQTKTIYVGSGNLTVLGGLAPGGGCAILGTVHIGASQVVWRHTRHWLDDSFGTETDPIKIGSGVPYTADNIIFDHVSCAFGQDNQFGMSVTDFGTIQNCMYGPTNNLTGGISRGPIIGGQTS